MTSGAPVLLLPRTLGPLPATIDPGRAREVVGALVDLIGDLPVEVPAELLHGVGQIETDLALTSFQAVVEDGHTTPVAELVLDPSLTEAESYCDCVEFQPCRHLGALCMVVAEILARGMSSHARRAADRLGDQLRALDRVLGLETPPDEDELRRVWRLEAHHGLVAAVLPYEQKRRAKGGWTKGRKLHWRDVIAVRGLRRPDERRLFEAVARHALDTASRYAATREGLGDLVEALEGSEHVFWDDDPERPVKVRRAHVGLAVVPVQRYEGGALADDDHDGPAASTGADPHGGRTLRLEVTLDGRRAPRPLQVVEATLLRVDRAADTVWFARLDLAQVQILRALGNESVEVAPHEVGRLLPRLQRLEDHFSLALPPRLEAPLTAAQATQALTLRLTDQGLDMQLRVLLGAAQLIPGRGEARFSQWSDGQRRRTVRDLDAEVAAAEAAATRLGLPVAPPHWEGQVLGEAAFDLLERLQAQTELALAWAQERPQVHRVQGRALRVELRGTRRDWFGLGGGVDLGEHTVPLAEVLARLEPGRRTIELEGGTWLRLSDALTERLERLRQAAHPGRKGELELGASAAQLVEDLVDEAGQAELDAGWQAVRARLSKARRVKTAPPKALRAELRPYQREGFAWLKRLSTWGVGACLADDMGLGKTVQTIGVLLARKRQGPALVVAPTSVGGNWARELARFAPSLKPRLYRDAADRDALLADLGDGHVVIASYDLVRIDVQRFTDVVWGTLVCDEAQHVKNSSTKTAQALRKLDAGWRLALSGTPIENHLGELWSLFRLLEPGLLGSWDRFAERFARPIERDDDPAARAALAALIQPFVLRRTKQQVLDDLPPRTDQTLEVALPKPQRAHYDQSRLALAQTLADPYAASGDGPKRDPEHQRFQVLAALTHLRQLACHPALVDETWTGGSAKLDALLELVADLRQNGHRALIFSQFTRFLRLACSALRAADTACFYLDGRTPAKQRQRRIDRFQAGEGDAFLISLKAGGQGLNLTGADYVIHLDPWWNPAVEDQATDRAHRIGQERPVTVYRLIAQGTIEAEVLELHASKRELVAGVLDGTGAAARLSVDDLLALVGGAL